MIKYFPNYLSNIFFSHFLIRDRIEVEKERYVYINLIYEK